MSTQIKADQNWSYRENSVREFSKEYGCQVTWNQHVDLGPKEGQRPLSADDEQEIWWRYHILQFTLQQIGCSLTIDRSREPRITGCEEKVDVAVLAPPEDCIGLLLEGARQVSDAFHLVLSASWLSTAPTDTGSEEVFLHKAVTFGRNGSTYLDVFQPPRRVTYFLQSCRGDFLDVAQLSDGRLDCPRNNTAQPVGDDRAAAHVFLENAAVDFPSALMFTFRSDEHSSFTDPRFSVRHLTKPVDKEVVRKDVEDYFQKPSLQTVDKIVIHPVHQTGLGPQETADIGRLVQTVLDVLEKTADNDHIILEPFVQCLRPFQRKGEVDAGDNLLQWSADDTVRFLVKSLVCRDFNNKPVTSSVVCLVAKLNSTDVCSLDKTLCLFDDQTSALQSLGSTLREFNVANQKLRDFLETDIRRKGEAVLQAIIDSETASQADPRSLLQTDFIGIDFVIAYKNGDLCPTAVKVTTHPEFAAFQRFELTNMAFPNLNICLEAASSDPRQQRAFQPLVATMVMRSQDYVLRGKRILVIAAGWITKKDLWPPAFAAGIKVVAVDSNPDHFIKNDVERFIHYDFEDRKRETEHATNIVRLVNQSEDKIDGCFTFWEPSVELHAMICEQLNLKGNSVSAAQNAKEKSRTQNALYTLRTRSVLVQNVRDYVTPAYLIKSPDDLEEACQKVKFPAMLKTETGAASLGCTEVRTVEDLRKAFTRVTDTVKEHPIIAFGFGEMVNVEEFHVGSKHVVDLAIFNKSLVAAFVSDCGLVNPPSFTGTAALMPSALPGDKQAQVIMAAFQCCVGIGLTEGMFNADIIMTSSGPKLVEINARMGGYCLRHWIRRLYHQDILLMAYKICVGIRPYVPQTATTEYIISVYLSPTHHKELFKDPDKKAQMQALHDSGKISLSVFDPDLEDVWGDFEIPCANVAVTAPSVQEGKERLITVCRELGIEKPQYRVSQFIKYF
ncbi:carnosine synthase 1-like [Mya arenaria]|uniref:carnosine synthase 1-like n=1 Tax=Mya arenaria TaxID=6604 RepID=UPI0022E77293|nr:carnosine synthase 1-like [Mya arenaria]